MPGWAQTQILDVSEATTRPVPIKTKEPEYTEEARVHGVSDATVLLTMTISADGYVSDVRVLRPAGFGLDEAAVGSVSTWRFRPATKDGLPVAVRATAELTFRTLDRPPDVREARVLKDLLAELAKVKTGGDPRADDPVRGLRTLAASGYAEAQYALADLVAQGTLLAYDAGEEKSLLESAAKQGHVSAMARLGKRHLEEGASPRGMELLRMAARLGSLMAQRTFAERLELTDAAAALPYYRACASQNDSRCQLRAGSILSLSGDAGDRKEAAAWLMHARANGAPEAQEALGRFTPPLTDRESAQAEQLGKSLIKSR